MHRTLLLPAALTAFALVLPSVSVAAPYVPGEVIVKYRDGTTTTVQERVEDAVDTEVEGVVPDGSRQLEVGASQSVAETVQKLKDDPNVAYAVPNYVARASAFLPNDPAFGLQWHLGSSAGIGAPEAWDLARGLGAPGGRGALVAVLDTGAAYRTRGRFKRSPDFGRRTFTRGYDFVDDDRFPDDYNGHGTFVSAAVAEATDNGTAGAGLAYRTKIMPIRVLNARGEGDTLAISRGIRYAARRRADVINLSLEFFPGVRAADIPNVTGAIRYARRRGALVVAAAGNTGDLVAAYPARAKYVLGVGASTHNQCSADYSNVGPGVDVVAPGGGPDAALAENQWDAGHCRPAEGPGLDIFQQSYTCSPLESRRCFRRFGLPPNYVGTSMAAPQVSATAALVMATRRLGSRRPSPDVVQAWLKVRARDLGAQGPDLRYGAGLVDAASALRIP